MDHNAKSNMSRKKKIVISVLVIVLNENCNFIGVDGYIYILFQDEPFFMIRPPEEGKNLTGNDQYMGYCVDLTRKLAEMLGFDYEIRPVRDRKFGIQGKI